MYWFDNLNKIMDDLQFSTNHEEVENILLQLDSDLVIEGENPLLEAMNKLTNIGENVIVNNWLFPMAEKIEEKNKEE